MITVNEGHVLYIQNLRRLGRREKTIENYKASLKEFLEKYGSLGTRELNIDMLFAYQDFLLTRNLAPRVYKNYVINLRAFARFLNLEELSNVKLHRMGIPQAKKTPMSVLSQKELESILMFYFKKAHSRSVKDARDFAFYFTLYSTGCRISEALSLQRDCYLEGWTNVCGKGSKIRKIYFSPQCQMVLNMYVSCRTDGYPPLFVNLSNNTRSEEKDKRLSPSYIRKDLKKTLKALNINKKVTPHTFRHTFATFLWQDGKGLDVKKIMEMLGHSTIATTDEYIHQLSNGLRDEFLEHHYVPLFKKN